MTYYIITCVSPSRPHICHEYHELYSWRTICQVEKFQFSVYGNWWEIENFSTGGEISVQLMEFYCNLCRFVAKSIIHAVLSRNFATIYALSCEEKLSPKLHLWRKNDKYEVWTELLIDTENDNYMMMTNKTEIVDICVV